MSQKWCWGLILLAIFLISFSNTLLIVLMPKQPIYVTVGPEAWGADPARPGLKELKLPVEKIVVTDTRDAPDSCKTKESCILRVQQLQREAFARNLSDIPYNFLFGDDGNVYEARGFRFFGEIETNESSTEIGIVLAFIGTFDDQTPSSRQKSIYTAFLEKSSSQGFLANNYSITFEDEITNSRSSSGLRDVVNDSHRVRSFQPIISRASWGAKEPKDPDQVIKYNQPIKYVVITQIYPDSEGLYCSTFIECAPIVERIQDENFLRGFNDIESNFLITPMGVYEGRGWNIQSERLYDSSTLVIGFISDFLSNEESKFLDNLMEDGKFLHRINENFNLTCNESFCSKLDLMVNRSEWNARPANGEIKALNHPIRRIVVKDLTLLSFENCYSKNNCEVQVQSLQTLTIDEGSPDIPFNFVIAGDGFYYEGRGENLEGEIIADEPLNSLSLIVGFMGDFKEESPVNLINTLRMLLKNLIGRNVVSSNYTVLFEGELTNNLPDTTTLVALRSMRNFYGLLPIVYRSSWGAQNPVDETKSVKFDTPPTKVYLNRIVDDGVELSCSNLESCSTILRSLQELDFLHEFNDVEFNFLISSYGIFEGRGWKIRPEEPQDIDSISINFLNGDSTEMIPELRVFMEKLLEDGKVTGKLSENFEIVCEEFCEGAFTSFPPS